MKDRIKQYQFKAESLTDEGQVEAVFSTFNVIDRDGDVILPEAIHDGKEIAMVWAHDWSKPIGKGTIYNDGSKATFKGGFFLDTDAGQEAYKTVKNMGELQQYSWGFRVLTQEKGERNGKAVNLIKDTEEFEVSPVLIGSNMETYTVAIKDGKTALSAKDSSMASTADISCDHSDNCTKCLGSAKVAGSYEALRDDLNAAFKERQFADNMYGGYSYVVATFSDHFIAMLYNWDDDEESYWDVSYGRTEGGDLVLGDPKQVEPLTEFVPVTSDSNGQPTTYAYHADMLRAVATEFVRRSKSVSDGRRKEGRPISSARRERMEGVASSLESAVSEIRGLLEETAPNTDNDEDTGKMLYAEFLKLEAALQGVEV